MSDTVQVAFIGLIGTILTIIVVPGVAWAWKQWEEHKAEIKKRGREEERAETYKSKATAAIDQKNIELAERQAENAELRSWISRLTDTEIPRLQRKVDRHEETIATKDETIATLADAFKKLANQEVES